MGVTHHRHGTDTVRLIATLALMRGMVGKDGAGLLPLRGHSNIQGLGTVGVTPQLKAAIFANLEKRFALKLPTTAGMDTLACMDRAAAGGVDVAWCLGGNLFGSNPDAAYAQRALAAVDQVVYLNTTLNTGHVHGRGRETWILPVLPRDEEPEPTTQESMFSYIRLSDAGKPRHAGPRSEVRVIAALARAVLGDGGAVDWRALEHHADIRRTIAEVVPGLEQLAEIDRTRHEFHIPGRAYHDPDFKTGDHHAHIRPITVPDHGTLGERQLRVMTIRSEGQFNTVVYEDHDRYRDQERRDVILMNRVDRERMGLAIDQRVTVTSSVGTMTNILVREMDIRAGNAAMYYPEANVLVPREIDPESRTPAFKHVVVTIGS
jgi:anaerobic selenocysteine-containing dehydrogenase